MSQMLELADKKFGAAIITMLQDLKEKEADNWTLYMYVCFC